MKCKFCGALLEEEGKFCAECGKSIEITDEQSTQVETKNDDVNGENTVVDSNNKTNNKSLDDKKLEKTEETKNTKDVAENNAKSQEVIENGNDVKPEVIVKNENKKEKEPESTGEVEVKDEKDIVAVEVPKVDKVENKEVTKETEVPKAVQTPKVDKPEMSGITGGEYEVVEKSIVAGAVKSGSEKKAKAKSETKEKKKADRAEKKADKKAKKKVNKKPKEKVKFGVKMLIFSRYFLAAVVLLFAVSIFFKWFTLSGNCVNMGYTRNDKTVNYLVDEIKDKSADELYSYEGPIATYSGYKLMRFGIDIGKEYDTFVGKSGVDSLSFVSVIHKYYMFALAFLFFSSLFSIIVALFSKKLKFIGTVRTLSIVNAIIIGLNYLAIRLPFFSMFGVRAKQTLLEINKNADVNLSSHGMSFMDKFYGYNMFIEKGLYTTLILLLIWFVLSTILKEVKDRADRDREIREEQF